MKVLQIVGNGLWSGRLATARSIVRAQVRQGDRVWVLALDDLKTARLDQAGATAVKPPLWLSPLQPPDLRAFLHLVVLCRSERFDLIVAHTNKAALLGRLAARVAGVPRIVHHAQNCTHRTGRSGLMRLFCQAVERLSARAGDLVITTSEEERNRILQDCTANPSRTVTILAGVPSSGGDAGRSESVRNKLGIGPAERVIGSAGRLVKEGGFQQLLHALPRVLARHPRVRVVIAGHGPFEEDLRQEAVLMGLDDRVSFLGEGAGATDLFAAIDIFVYPSAEPAAPFPLLQAIGAGKPVVACDNVVNREIVQHRRTAILVPASAREIARAISGLLENPDQAAELAARARAVSARRFSLHRMIEQSLAAYRQGSVPETPVHVGYLGARSGWSGRPD